VTIKRKLIIKLLKIQRSLILSLEQNVWTGTYENKVDILHTTREIKNKIDVAIKTIENTP
jgi:hypothetical protein